MFASQLHSCAGIPAMPDCQRMLAQWHHAVSVLLLARRAGKRAGKARGAKGATGKAVKAEAGSAADLQPRKTPRGAVGKKAAAETVALKKPGKKKGLMSKLKQLRKQRWFWFVVFALVAVALVVYFLRRSKLKA